LPGGAEAIAADAGARRRFSFSQLTGRLAVEEEEAVVDVDVEIVEPGDEVQHRRGAGPDGRAFGKLVHAALERVDLRRQDDVRPLCEFLAPAFIDMAPESAAREAAELIERFLHSPRAAELAAASVVRRELEFLLPWPPGGAGREGRYLHGYIDCLYQGADGRWRLIDYKTNRVAATAVPQLVKLYELQMLVYSLACEQALGEPLAECALVLLQPGVEHSYAWDGRQRQRGVDEVTAAIESLTRHAKPAEGVRQ
jgi:ATP-dependent exoDNAse (exonuclease V) beta subunit